MGETGFKHIAVTAAEEDDFVIKAGIVEDGPAEPATSASTEPAPAEPASVDPEINSEKREVKPAATRKPAPKKADGYRETTLEDLEAKPMPLTQKVVIVAAILCIIGAVIYCVAFMG